MHACWMQAGARWDSPVEVTTHHQYLAGRIQSITESNFRGDPDRHFLMMVELKQYISNISDDRAVV